MVTGQAVMMMIKILMMMMMMMMMMTMMMMTRFNWLQDRRSFVGSNLIPARQTDGGNVIVLIIMTCLVLNALGPAI